MVFSEACECFRKQYLTFKSNSISIHIIEDYLLLKPNYESSTCYFYRLGGAGLAVLRIHQALLDMGIEHYLIGDSVVGIIAQRLVRRLCPECKEHFC